MEWLLEQSALDKLIKAEMPSGEESAKYVKDDFPEIMSIVGNVAKIEINGPLTDKRNWILMWLFGANTTYSEISDSVAMAISDPNVESIQFNINSPGGMASAQWIAAMDAINLAQNSKPTKAIVSSMAASGAYGLASQAGEIIAQNRMSLVGSVGVVSTHTVSDDIIDIRSTNAPKKKPDVKTEAGQKIIQERLDVVHDVFVRALARGRGTTVDDVNANFGQGALLIAQEAIGRGMIDKIGIDSSDNNSGNNSKVNLTEENMDLEKLKSEHPALYAQVVAEGESQGVEKERKRATAHLILGKTSGAFDVAHDAIKDGTSASDEITFAKYTAARIDKTDIDTRADETQKTEVELAAEKEEQLGSQVADAVEEKLGIGVGGKS